MELKKIQINGFGNTENKIIDLTSGINILYGKNESGKSTIAGFVKGIFYGINKNKAGNEFSEYDKYKPWNNIDFSGKLEYELKNKTYTVFRDFARNNCKVYDEKGNEITNEFNKDKTRGAEVGVVHLGVDEETFMNTLFVMQKNIDLEIQSQKNLIQKLTNMLQSGQEGISFEKIRNKLQKKVLDEIGTDRSRNKPINVLKKDIDEKEQIRNRLMNNRDRKCVLENINMELEEQKKKLEEDMSQVRKVLDVKEKYISLIEEKERTYELTLKIKEKEREDKLERNKVQFRGALILMGIATTMASLALIYYKHYYWCIVEIMIAVIASFVLYKTNKIDFDTTSLPDLAIIKEELNKKESKELEKLRQKGIKQMFVERRVQELKNLLSGYEKKKNDLILEGHKVKIEEESLKENIERLSDIEEQLNELREKKEKMQLKSKIINIAINKLDEAYEELKQEVIPEMERNIKSMVAETTNQKYIDVIYNNENGILVENSVGELVQINKLSTGTIDQMYLGFRLGVSKKIEELPVILDESFAYYDDERLKNILKTLSKLDRQIIVMTCSDREQRLLKELNIKHNYIEV